jgi:hypothetical protein
MIKKYKLFIESLYRNDVDLILSNPGWVENEPSNKNWLLELSKLLQNDIYIVVLKFRYRNELNYYLRKGTDNNNLIYVGTYGKNYIKSYSSKNYEIMINTCKYLVPYFTKKPSEDVINDIGDLFIEISDILSNDFHFHWGYKDKYDESIHFPATSSYDDLVLLLKCQTKEHINLEKFTLIENEFNLNKNRLPLICNNIGDARISMSGNNMSVLIELIF